MEQKITENMSVFGYLKESIRHLLSSGIMFSKFSYYGVKLLFSKHPNKTWVFIVLCLGAYYINEIAKARTERDAYSVENAVLIDSIDRINHPQVRYVNMHNQITTVKSISKNGSSED